MKVVEYILRVKDEATGNVGKAAAAVDGLSDELDAVEAQAKAATDALRGMGDDGSAAAAKVRRDMIAATDAEKAYIAQVIGSNAAVKAKADAFGVSESVIRQMNKALEDSGASLSSAAVGAGAASSAMSAASRSTGDMARTAGALAQQLPDVFSQLAAGANPMQVFLQQGLQVVQQLNAMTVASKAASAVASPLGLALAAVAASVAVVANETADARREMDEYRKLLGDTDSATRKLIQSQNALKLAQGDVAGFIGDLQIQTALLEGSISDADVRAGELGGTLADKLKPQLMEAGKELAAAQVELQGLNEAFASGNVAAGDLDAFIKRREALQQAIPVLQSNIDAIKTLGTDGRAAINAYAAAMEQADEKASSLSGSLEKVAESAQKVASINLGDPAALASAGLQAPATFDRIDADAVEQAFAQAMGSAEVVTAFQRLAAQSIGAAGRAGGAIAAGANALANPGQALAAAGPVGQGLAALAAIGQAGTDRIVAQLTDFGTSIVDGIAMLPELFGRLLVELPVALAEAVAQAIRNIFTGGNDGLFGGFQPFKGKLTAREILGIGSLGLTELTGIGRAADAAFGGNQGFAAGDTRYISRTGLAVVHQGETMTRANGGTAAGIAGGGHGGWGGPPIVIQTGALSSDVYRQMSDDIGRDFDPNGWGRGTRTVFGG